MCRIANTTQIKEHGRNMSASNSRQTSPTWYARGQGPAAAPSCSNSRAAGPALPSSTPTPTRSPTALNALGVKPGERIAYLGKNSDIYFEVLFGATKASAVMAPVNWRLAAPEVAFIVEDCKAPVLFVGPEFIDAGRSDPIAIARACATSSPWRAARRNGRTFGLARRAERRRSEGRDRARGHRDPALHLRHHRPAQGRDAVAREFPVDLVRNRRRRTADWNTWGDDDVSLVAMPVFHIGGTGWGVMGLYHGAKGVVAREFDPDQGAGFHRADASPRCSWCRRRCRSWCASRAPARSISRA